MSVPVVALLLMGAVFLTLAIERERGVVEPSKIKEYEKEIETQKNKAKGWQNLCDEYKRASEDALETIDRLEKEINQLKEKETTKSEEDQEDEYRRGYKEGFQRGLDEDEERFDKYYDQGYSAGHRDGYEKGFRECRILLSPDDEEQE